MAANLLGSRWGQEKAAFFSLSLFWRQYFILCSLRWDSSSHLHCDTSLWGCTIFFPPLLPFLQHISSPSQGWYFCVNFCALKHIINNPACSKWMTCPSVAVISWTSTSLEKVGTQVNSWIIEGTGCKAAVPPCVKYRVDEAEECVPHMSQLRPRA